MSKTQVRKTALLLRERLTYAKQALQGPSPNPAERIAAAMSWIDDAMTLSHELETEAIDTIHLAETDRRQRAADGRAKFRW